MNTIKIEGKVEENPWGNWSDVDKGWYIGVENIQDILNLIEGKRVRVTIEPIEEEERPLQDILFDAAKIIISSEIDWPKKYDLIFSAEISDKFKEKAPDFTWHDPDSSYEDDVLAWIRAAKEYIKNI